MKINLRKERFVDIEKGFNVLKENPDAQSGLKMIKDSLDEIFDLDFSIIVVRPHTLSDSQRLFFMSVYPEKSTMDKIVEACITGKDNKVIQSLWEKNKAWMIELDIQLFNKYNFNERELTAMLLHEVGHVICSNGIRDRISTILRYEIAKSNASTKMLLKDKIFARIMSLPILDACIADCKRDKTSIKEELRADSFVAKMGYRKDLQNVLERLLKENYMMSAPSIDDKMKQVSAFSISTLEDFQRRRDKLAKQHLLDMKEATDSPYIKEVISEFIDTVFEDGEDCPIPGRKLVYMHDRADKDIEGYIQESFIVGGHLKRIDPSEIDYIQIMMNQITSAEDQMMLISYLHNKMDMVDYYISILENPTTAKKYNVPHRLEELKSLKERLTKLREDILSYKIPDRKKNILISWPTGYEG